MPQGFEVALSSCHPPHPAYTYPGQAVPGTGPSHRTGQQVPHGPDRGHNPKQHPTPCPRTHLQIHLVLDGLPIRPPQPAPRLPCGQGTPWAVGTAQPRGGLQPGPLRQDTTASRPEELGPGQPTTKGWLSGCREGGVPGRGCPRAPHSPISSPMLKW